jgi:hypothetical protein
LDSRNEQIYSVRVTDAALRSRIESYRLASVPALSRNAAMLSLVTLGLNAAQVEEISKADNCQPSPEADEDEKGPHNVGTFGGSQNPAPIDDDEKGSTICSTPGGPQNPDPIDELPSEPDPLLPDDVARARVLPSTPVPMKPFSERGNWRKTRKVKAERRAANVARRAAAKSAPPQIEVDGERVETVASNGHGAPDKLLPAEAEWLLKRFPDGYVDEESARRLNMAVSVADRCGMSRGSESYFDFLDSVMDEKA